MDQKFNECLREVGLVFFNVMKDHVALILRCDNNKLAFIDATTDNGVSICGWKTFIHGKCFKEFHQIIFRSLNFARTDSNITRLEAFLKVFLHFIL